MLTGLAALDETDWSKLHHAYGPATDTPTYLRALLSDDAEARQEAIQYLWGAILHQGTPVTVTGPASAVIAGLVFDKRVRAATRASLIEFLTGVAEAAEAPDQSIEQLERDASHDIDALLESENADTPYEDEAIAKAFVARAVLGCIRVLPQLKRVMLDGFDDPDHRVRMQAVNGAVIIFRRLAPAGEPTDLRSRFLALAAAAETLDERCSHVLALGDIGVAPVVFLDDPSPAVRVCAALAPALAKDERATNELIAALENHAGSVDEWFTHKPPQFPMQPRFRIVSRLIEEVASFDRLVRAAEAILPVTSQYNVGNDWGPLLVAAFPDGSGIVTTDAQSRFLTALTRQVDLWDRGNGNAYPWFKRAGLPYDRQECARRAKPPWFKLRWQRLRLNLWRR